MYINWSGYYNYVSIGVNTGSPSYGSGKNYVKSGSIETPTKLTNGKVKASGLLYNTQYTFTVTLYNGNSVGYALSSQSSYTLANVMSATATTNSTTNMVVSIVSSNGYASYPGSSRVAVYRGTNTTIIGNITTTANNYTDSGLTANTPYKYWLTPYNGNGVANTQLFVGNTYTLGNIVSANLTAISSTSITANVLVSNGYTTFPDSTRIAVYRDSSTNIIANITTGNSYISTGLSANTHYNYWLTPYNGNGVAKTKYYVGNLYTFASGSSLDSTPVSG